MKNYFQEVISSLTYNDMKVLGILFDNEADASFKAMKNTDILERTKLTEANYRKIIYRLVASKFIEVINHQKNKNIYITDFGVQALQTTMKGVGA